jgi:cyclopropane fatty-acyl-phospholipid synthase-like methyltransferase
VMQLMMNCYLSLSDYAPLQARKLGHLIARAGIRGPQDRVLDLGFGWGGLSIRLAETVRTSLRNRAKRL